MDSHAVAGSRPEAPAKKQTGIPKPTGAGARP